MIELSRLEKLKDAPIHLISNAEGMIIGNHQELVLEILRLQDERFSLAWCLIEVSTTAKCMVSALGPGAQREGRLEVNERIDKYIEQYKVSSIMGEMVGFRREK